MARDFKTPTALTWLEYGVQPWSPTARELCTRIPAFSETQFLRFQQNRDGGQASTWTTSRPQSKITGHATFAHFADLYSPGTQEIFYSFICFHLNHRKGQRKKRCWNQHSTHPAHSANAGHANEHVGKSWKWKNMVLKKEFSQGSTSRPPTRIEMHLSIHGIKQMLLCLVLES